MKIIYRISFALLFAAFFSQSAFAQAEWTGRYEFGEDGGETAGGTKIYVHHEIEVIDADDGMIAFLKSNGFQTSRDLVCTVTIEGTKMKLNFESYGEDNVLADFKPGELLLTLERKTEKGKTTLLTHWGAYKPIVPKNEKSGAVYFTKIDKIETEDLNL